MIKMIFLKPKTFSILLGHKTERKDLDNFTVDHQTKIIDKNNDEIFDTIINEIKNEIELTELQFQCITEIFKFCVYTKFQLIKLNNLFDVYHPYSAIKLCDLLYDVIRSTNKSIIATTNNIGTVYSFDNQFGLENIYFKKNNSIKKLTDEYNISWLASVGIVSHFVHSGEF